MNEQMINQIAHWFHSAAHNETYSGIYARETHVVERIGDVGETIDVLLYCEDSKAAYKLHYNQECRSTFIQNFLQPRIASNTTLVCHVFNMFQTSVDEEHMKAHNVRDLWQRVKDAPVEDVVFNGSVENGTLNLIGYDGYDHQMIRFESTTEKQGEICIFVGLHDTLYLAYCNNDRSSEYLFDLVGLDGGEMPILRIRDPKTGEQIAAITPSFTDWMRKEDFEGALRDNCVWNDQEKR